MKKTLMQNVEAKTPLIHCITNYVTVNDCANMILAAKGSPIMADDIQEVEEITSICDALVINIGTLNERTIQSMIKAGKKANALNHPVILDPVGAGASTLRTETVKTLLKEVNFTIIRGNISEIKTVYLGCGTTKGVDADVNDLICKETLTENRRFVKDLAKQTGAIVVVTGTIDLVADENQVYAIYNGHSSMSRITGTGCQLTTLLSVYATANPAERLDACVMAVSMMGLAGEIGVEKMQKEHTGTNSLRTYIIDAISTMDYNTWKQGARYESI